ncbi:sensor histidine kinase [Bacillus sp. FSL K6-3431]|uniref:sensor histidine kinase n=1 Tax=Bacillus sp. FSL K6-3431 TaxID=2921500 RepID=UPI0030F725C9
MNWLLIKKILRKKKIHSLNKRVTESIDSLPDKPNEQKSPENYDEVIGRMAAFFAHEIRNPLTSIIGFAQFLEQDQVVQSNHNISQYLSIIKEEALRMESLIKELLSLSTTDFHQDNLSIIDMKYSIEKVITIFSMQPNHANVQFSTSFSDETYINGNVGRFEQLLINLINNAIEASNDDCIIDIHIEKENEYASVLISDNGIGIPVEQLEQIFFPLYTTKDEGTGVGLPICKAIVETLNGTISIQNNLPKGTQVKLRIPLMKDPA